LSARGGEKRETKRSVFVFFFVFAGILGVFLLVVVCFFNALHAQVASIIKASIA
jgi:hypothetical protein